MTIIDFPRGGRGTAATAHPTSRFRSREARVPTGRPPTGAWLTTYEELAACCAEIVAGPPAGLDAREWEELIDWIRSRLVLLDQLKAGGAS